MKVWKCTIMDGNKWKSYYFILHLVLCFFASFEKPCKAKIALSANILWFWPKWNKILYNDIKQEIDHFQIPNKDGESHKAK